MKSQLYIPEKINVGFQNRKGTYTGKLAYIIYYDHTGKLRKEKSWNSWRDDQIENMLLENEPTAGFVLNKGVGGARQSYGWDTRNEYIRVYDPRGFEFEISVANLLFILQECNCDKGKGLDGKFVYSWSGTELVLLPTIASDYIECIKYTSIQSMKFSIRNLKVGHTYKSRNDIDWTYLGRLDFYKQNEENKKRKYREHIFYDGQKFGYGINNLAYASSTDTHSSLAEYQKLYYESEYGSKAVEIYSEKLLSLKEDYYYYKFIVNPENKNEILRLRKRYLGYSYYHSLKSHEYPCCKLSIVDGLVQYEEYECPAKLYYENEHQVKVFIKLESGIILESSDYGNFYKKRTNVQV